MKVIYCQICGSIVSPGRGDRSPASCACGTHRCWLEDGASGQFRVEYVSGHPLVNTTGAPKHHTEVLVWVLGLSNSFLQWPTDETPSAMDIEIMLENIPDSYLFKKTRSMIVRFRPGQTSDTAWAKFEP